MGTFAPRVAYLMSRYPAVTETFILHEMLALKRLGVDIEIFPLFGKAGKVRHPGSEELSARVHYHRALSLEFSLAQRHWLLRHPRRYLRAWGKALRGNAPSLEFLLKALVVVPRAAVLARRMEEQGIRHIHAHWATYPALAALVIRELTGIGYSFTAHAHDLYLDRTMLAEKIEAARFVVTISRFNRSLIRRQLGASAATKVVVIPCGIHPQLFEERPPRVPDGIFRIACVAALRDYKGHRWLIDACALLKERGLPFHCSLVGDGPARRGIEEQIVAAGLEDHVALLGDQPHDRIRALIAEADAMALASVVTQKGMMDGIPVALMEAMACAVPVVATSVSGIPELVRNGRTGLLVPEKDARALADALELLFRDSKKARLIALRGRGHVLDRFNLLKNACRLRDHFVSVSNVLPDPEPSTVRPHRGPLRGSQRRRRMPTDGARQTAREVAPTERRAGRKMEQAAVLQDREG
ncbi:MAG TPA: glycosyltransferase [Anaeromyxobacteraceae bacterium]|nr:glycosyltransferase [Anaeromyxobacteraceae bacterium]